ncbi:MAG: hypothetical protein LBU61_01240 [Coriobacteriales bacterium]|jgi:hypothetical protein|nr:hypothetical protein [Coriobacteriales bacterium]
MAYSLSPKENYLLCMNHKHHEYTPGPGDMVGAGMMLPIERGEGGAGIDAFGVRWVAPTSGGPGAALPAPNEFKLTDVTKWKSVVEMPDLSVFDWEGTAAMELANVDRDTQSVDIIHANCIYERMATLMGFEGALLAMALEPEASFELLEALANWRIEGIKYFAKYYQPDVYMYFDDVATERNLFMSPDTYRALIKPLHVKFVKACQELGIIPVQHTCGKADLLVQDMIDEGNHAWNAVQSQNDLEGIIEAHGDHFVLMGGYNTTGTPGQPYATEDEVRAEVRRCIETYGKYGKGYVFSGLVLTALNPADPMDMGAMNNIIIDEFLKIRAEKEAAA